MSSQDILTPQDIKLNDIIRHMTIMSQNMTWYDIKLNDMTFPISIEGIRWHFRWHHLKWQMSSYLLDIFCYPNNWQKIELIKWSEWEKIGGKYYCTYLISLMWMNSINVSRYYSLNCWPPFSIRVGWIRCRWELISK